MKLLELAPGRWAHASGALWLNECQTAMFADVHLGYGWALRRRGQLGPVQEGAVRRKLMDTIAELQPKTIVFVGDVVHAPRPAPLERDAVEATLSELAQMARLVLIPGNHDRGFHKDYPGAEVRLAPEWRECGLHAVHGHVLPATDQHLVLGHIHPALGIVDHAGATQKVPVFVCSERLTILPAFSPLSSGGDIRVHMPPELARMLPPEATRIVAASGKRVVALGPLSRLSRLPSAW
ncbi:MAG TPA: metallophosphoesterase [Bryobacteraceae bacterium]|nr:metallophosphoesterase [Bryobacteraceae bacterium]